MGAHKPGFHPYRFSKHPGIFLFLAAAFAACARPAAAGQTLRLEQSTVAMGSTYTIAVYGEDEQQMQAAVADAFEEVHRLDDLLSNYNAESPWSQINQFGFERAVKTPRELFELLQACVNYSRASDGAFDISVGPLMRVWGFYKGTGHLPKAGEVETAEKKVGYRNLELDPAAETVRLKTAGADIDPGGIGKGYAVDKMVDVLRKDGISVGLVSASGSSIYAMGKPPGQDGWHVEIKDPRDQRKTSTEVVLADESMSTSGSYEKFFQAEGRIYSHIMDPRTGYPAQGMLSVSVITPKTLDSEAWTKPLFINGRQWAQQHRDRLPAGTRAYFCEDKPNQPCAWLQ